MLTILEELSWFEHTLQRATISGNNGEQVPCHILWPKSVTFPTPFILATHGATSSKHEWTELDGYTKGGNLSRELLASGIAIIAMDWHYHGDNNSQNLNGRNVFADAHFDDFFRRSAGDAMAVIDYTRTDVRLDPQRMGFSGYSLGGLFGFWLANHGVEFKAMTLCVPGVTRETTKFYASSNNLDHLQDIAILQVSAENDEYIAFPDSQWLFDRIPLPRKTFLSFASGHSLPVEYVKPVADWIVTNLRG